MDSALFLDLCLFAVRYIDSIQVQLQASCGGLCLVSLRSAAALSARLFVESCFAQGVECLS
jgi:hypothetical protein